MENSWENDIRDLDVQPEENLVLARGIKKTFANSSAQIDILKSVDLSLRIGETVAIVGASGIGKSTLLQILGTLDLPDDGHLWFQGRNILKLEPAQLAGFRNTSIGFVFQFHHLLPEFTALENAMMPALISGMPKQQAIRQARQLLDEVGLEHRLKHKPGELSGGEQQRVAIARALVMDPEILLADEPTGNLDTETGKKIEDILVNLNTTKKITLIVVTHNKLLADRMSGRIGLRDGKIYDF